MRKNGSRLISLRQYRLTDSVIFALILAAFDLIAYGALSMFGASAYFTFTMTLPITLLVMMRWGWQSVFYAVADGLILSFLYNRTVWQSYLSYAAGGAALMLILIPFKLIGKQRIRDKWYLTAAAVLAGWFVMNTTVTVIQTVCGADFLNVASYNFGVGLTGLMSLAAGLVVILVMRRLDGMFEDQKHYLIRLDKERKEKMRRDEFGDEPIEIDREFISILNKKDNGLY